MSLPTTIDPTELGPFNQSNPLSLYNAVSPHMQERLRDPLVQEYMQMSEKELVDLIEPSETLCQLRTNFWYEYNKRFHATASRQTGAYRVLSPDYICYGVCNPMMYYNHIAKNPKQLAFLFTPPADYSISIRETLYLGVKRLREVMALPLIKINKDGTEEVDTKLIELMIKIYANLDIRVNGSIPQIVKQSVESKTLNYNVTQRDVEQTNAVPMNLEQIESELSKLKGIVDA